MSGFNNSNDNIDGDDDDVKMCIIYENEFKTLLNSIDDNNNNNNNTDEIIANCNDCLKQLEIESRQLLSAEKKKIYLSKIVDYKSLLMRKKESIQRSQLINDKSISDRERMMNVQDKLNRQNVSIMNATKCVAETEEVGISITKELEVNRTKIAEASNKTKDINTDLDSAKKMLKSMQSRENCNLC